MKVSLTFDISTPSVSPEPVAWPSKEVSVDMEGRAGLMP
jgi:hypothetical protein